MTQDNKPEGFKFDKAFTVGPDCTCGAGKSALAIYMHEMNCPIAQAAMADIQAQVDAGKSHDEIRAAALATKSPEEQQAIEANDSLSDAQIDQFARELIEVLRMYRVTRSEARRIVARMPPHIDRTKSADWRDPFQGSGMKLIKNTGLDKNG